MCTILSSRFDPSRHVLMIVLYIQPNTPSELLFENLDKLLSSVPSDSVPTFVCGDFNVNLRWGYSSVRILSELTAYHGFIQYVKQPTHRKGGTPDHIYVNRFFDDWTFVSDSCSLFRPFSCSSCSAVSESCVDLLTSEVVIHVVVYKCYGWFKFLFNMQIRRNW
jgi:hypothetical protein